VGVRCVVADKPCSRPTLSWFCKSSSCWPMIAGDDISRSSLALSAASMMTAACGMVSSFGCVDAHKMAHALSLTAAVKGHARSSRARVGKPRPHRDRALSVAFDPRASHLGGPNARCVGLSGLRRPAKLGLQCPVLAPRAPCVWALVLHPSCVLAPVAPSGLSSSAHWRALSAAARP